MADEVTPEFAQRLTDVGPVEPEPGDWTTGNDAIRVLTEQGVDAWQRWCDEHAPDGPSPLS